jgi:hypothetical protein
MADLAKLNIALDTVGFDKVERDVHGVESRFSRLQANIISVNQALDLIQRGGAIAMGVLRAGFETLQAVTAAGSQQADAVRRLDQALVNAGQYTKSYSQELRDLASAQQATTTTGDELLIAAEAQLVAFGATRDNMGRTLQAAQDLAAGLGTDLSSSVFLLGKAMAGEFATLGRYGIFVDDNATKSEKLEQALAQIERRFGGQARAAAETYTGKLQQLSNASSDVVEELGQMVVASESVISTLGVLVDTVTDVATQTGRWRQDTDQVEPILRGIIDALLDGAEALAAWGTGWVNTTRYVAAHKVELQALLGLGAAAAAMAGQWKLATVVAATAASLQALPGEEALDGLEAGFAAVEDTVTKVRERVHQRWDMQAQVRQVTDVVNGFRAVAGEIALIQDRLAHPPDPAVEAQEFMAATGITDAARVQEAVQAAALARQDQLAQALRESRYEAGLFYREMVGRGVEIPAELQAQAKAMGLVGVAAADAAPRVHELSEAAQRAANAAATEREALIEQAAQLTQSLDPLEKYKAEMAALAKLQPFLKPEVEALAQQRIRDEYEETVGGLKDLKAEAKSIIDATRTPFEQLVAQLQLIQKLSSKGLLDEETTARAIAAARKEFEDLGRDADDLLGNVSEVAESFSQGVGDAFIEMRKTGQFEFRNLLEGLVDDVTRFLVTKTITQPLLRWLNDAIDRTRRSFSSAQSFDEARALAGLTGRGATGDLRGRLAGRGFSDDELSGLEQTVGKLDTSADAFQEHIAQAVDTTESGFLSMIGEVGRAFGSMISLVGSGLLGIFAGLFGGGDGGFSWSGLGKAIGFGALGNVIGGALDGVLSQSFTTTNAFDQTFTGPGAADLPPGVTGTYPGWGTRATPVNPMAFRDAAGIGGAEAAGDRASRVRAGLEQVITVNVPVSIPVTSLDDRNAAQVIMRNMPLIHSEIVRGINRGGALAKAVQRRA